MKLKYSFLLYLIILLAGCGNNTHQYNFLYGQENAIWCQSIYLRGFNPTTQEPLDDEKIKGLASTLKENNIKYAYLFAGPFDKTGHLPGFAFSANAINTVKLLKKYYPGLWVLPWIGGVQNRTVYLDKASWVNNALSDTRKMIRTLNVPGIHVDFEYILKGEPFLDTTTDKEMPGDRAAYGHNVIEFHKKLREILPKTFISSVVVATSPDTKPWKRKTPLSELKQLTFYINQLVFLYYDTNIHDPQLFEKDCGNLVSDIQTLKNANDIRYLIAIGTFVNALPLQKYRDTNIESIPQSLTVIKKSIVMVNPSKKLLSGVAIFCDWETSVQEWSLFHDNWVKN